MSYELNWGEHDCHKVRPGETNEGWTIIESLQYGKICDMLEWVDNGNSIPGM